MKQVVWFEKEQFLIKVLAEYFKQGGVSLLGLSELKQFVYLVEDFSPCLVVIDWEFIKDDAESFFKEWNSSDKLNLLPVRFVLPDHSTQSYQQYTSKVKFAGVLYKPIKTESLLKDLDLLN